MVGLPDSEIASTAVGVYVGVALDGTYVGHDSRRPELDMGALVGIPYLLSEIAAGTRSGMVDGRLMLVSISGMLKSPESKSSRDLLRKLRSSCFFSSSVLRPNSAAALMLVGNRAIKVAKNFMVV